MSNTIVRRVFRGGGYVNVARGLILSSRDWGEPEEWGWYVSLRLVIRNKT